MRKWVGLGLLALLLVVAVAVPGLLARNEGAPTGGWPSLSSLIVYEVHGRWPQGGASYAFAIEVHDDQLQPPPLLVKIDGKPVVSVRGGACWSSGGQVQQVHCTDMLSPAEQLAGKPAPVRKPGAKVEVSFPVAPEALAVYLVTSGGRVQASRAADGSLLLPERPATYVYEVDAQWPQGSGTYGFAVAVK